MNKNIIRHSKAKRFFTYSDIVFPWYRHSPWRQWSAAELPSEIDFKFIRSGWRKDEEGRGFWSL